jgi:hypothetical protein
MRLRRSGQHAMHRGVVLAAAVLCASSATSAPLFSDLTLSGSIGWSDNISGVANNQQTETMIGVGAQGVIGGNRQRSGLNGRFDLQYINYVNDEFDDQVTGNADLQGRYDLVPDMLSLVVEDTFGQTQTSEFAPSTPETRQNTNFLSAGADLRFDLPGNLVFLGSARYVIETYETTPADNTRWQGTGGLHYQFSGRSSLGLLAQAQDVSFSDSAPYDDFSRREMLLRYRIDAPRTTLQADGGRSEFRGRGVQQLRQNMWIYRVTMSRDLTARSVVNLSAGREISDGGDLFAASMEGFGASGNLRTMGLGAVHAIGNGVLATGDAMRTFYWGASWRITGPRSTGYVGVESREERYYSALSTSRDSLAVFAGFTRNLSNRTSLGLDVRSSRREADVTTIKVDDFSVTLTGGYVITQRLALSASFEYSDRRDSSAGGDYGDHRAWARLSWSPTRR